MAKDLQKILTNVDTFQSWITKTNQVIDVLATEVVTANSTLGQTGSLIAPRNAQLFGTFTANTLVATTNLIAGGINANDTHFTINSRILANNSVGSLGQILTSNGSGVYWSSLPVGSGTVTLVQGGNGLNGNITTSGALSVNAQTGLVSNSSGLYVNTSFIQSLIQTSPPTLSGPLNMNNNDIINADDINANSLRTVTSVRSPLYFIGQTSNHNLTAIDSNSVGLQLGEGPVLSFGAASGNGVRINNAGSIIFASGGSDRFTIAPNGQVTVGGIEIGFRTIPQLSTPEGGGTISTNAASGRHYYKTGSSSVILTIPDNTAESCPIGTTITFVNDGSVNITLIQGGATQLQLGGTFNVGSRTIAPGGFATALKVATNKWIVSGPGVS